MPQGTRARVHLVSRTGMRVDKFSTPDFVELDEASTLFVISDIRLSEASQKDVFIEFETKKGKFAGVARVSMAKIAEKKQRANIPRTDGAILISV